VRAHAARTASRTSCCLASPRAVPSWGDEVPSLDEGSKEGDEGDEEDEGRTEATMFGGGRACDLKRDVICAAAVPAAAPAAAVAIAIGNRPRSTPLRLASAPRPPPLSLRPPSNLSLSLAWIRVEASARDNPSPRHIAHLPLVRWKAAARRQAPPPLPINSSLLAGGARPDNEAENLVRAGGRFRVRAGSRAGGRTYMGRDDTETARPGRPCGGSAAQPLQCRRGVGRESDAQ
jgi:hypothetical protein